MGNFGGLTAFYVRLLAARCMPAEPAPADGVRASREPSRLLTPRAWQMEAMVRAAKLTGSPEGELALVEAKRYGLMADELERITAGVKVEGGSDGR